MDSDSKDKYVLSKSEDNELGKESWQFDLSNVSERIINEAIARKKLQENCSAKTSSMFRHVNPLNL